VIEQAHGLGVRVSLFMDAEADQMAAARAAGADRVELYTEPYAAAHAAANPEDPADPVYLVGSQASAPAEAGGAESTAVAYQQQLARFAAAAQAARDAGLAVNAGHDLNQSNLTPFLRAVPGVSEVSIGHALVADALEAGYASTVQAYLRCIAAAQG
jgi:pyridoxine 5-phosphate synthase